MSSIAKHYELVRHHQLIGECYNAELPENVLNGINHERERLEKFAPVEFAITKRYLLRYISADATIVDVGVGVGHYSELLASCGSRVHLVDVAERLLEAAQERLAAVGLAEQILSTTYASATDLSFIPDHSCDAVLMLGPFYNLSLAEERLKAAAEAHRVLRKGGLLFAAGINRMTMPYFLFQDGPEHILEKLGWFATYLRTGDFPEMEPDVPPIWNLTTIAEFRANFPSFQELALVGIESFAQGSEENLLKLTPEQAEAWLDLIEETGKTVEGLGMTGHFLFIGQK